MPFPDAAAHLQVPGNPLLSKMDILFYTSPVYFAAFFSMLHIPVSYHSTSDYIKNDSSQMFFRAELPVLGLDIYENSKLCYELFFPYDQPRFPSFRLIRLIILYYIPLNRTSVLSVFAVFILQFISQFISHL